MKPRIENLKSGNGLRILVLALVSFAVVSPLLVKGLPTGYDLPHHYQCAMTFVESIRSGDLYPAWSLNRNFGYGGMETRLYPPISHYTLALFFVATADWHTASFLTLFFFTFVGALGVYLWASEYVDAWHAVFAGCIFALLPYHLTQIYNTFFFAEYAGTSIMPFTFLFLARIRKGGSTADVIGLGIAFSALILTHLPLTVIGAFCFVVYTLAGLKIKNAVPVLARVGVGVLLGLSASAFFWMKVIQERSLIAKTDIYPDPWLDYRLHFLLTPIQQFNTELTESVLLNATLFYDLMFFCTVALAVVLTVPFAHYAKERMTGMGGTILVFLFAVFFATPLSRPVWDQISLLQEVQFPWRWLAVVSITAPVLASRGMGHLLNTYRSSRRPLAIMVTGCVLMIVTYSLSQVIRPAPFIPSNEIETSMAEYQGDKGFIFWWTIWSRDEALQIKEKVLADTREVTVSNWEATKKEFSISPGVNADARVALFYHPNWKVTVNGQQVDTFPDETGALKFPVPDSTATVQVAFNETTPTVFGRWLSLLVWFGFGIFGAVKLTNLVRSRKRQAVLDPSGEPDFAY